MNTQFKKGVLEICVLVKVYIKDMYGYEIIQSISKDIEVNEGTVSCVFASTFRKSHFFNFFS